MLQDLMREFEKQLDLGSLATENPDIYAIPIDEDVLMKIAPLNQGFSLSCVMGQCPKFNKEVFFSKIMQANLFGQGTHGAVLGLSDDGNMLTLSQEVEYNIEYKDFRDVIEDFFNTVDFWREEARKHK
jgi:hypothetical protein